MLHSTWSCRVENWFNFHSHKQCRLLCTGMYLSCSCNNARGHLQRSPTKLAIHYQDMHYFCWCLSITLDCWCCCGCLSVCSRLIMRLFERGTEIEHLLIMPLWLSFRSIFNTLFHSELKKKLGMCSVTCHILRKVGIHGSSFWLVPLPGTSLAQRQRSAWMFSVTKHDASILQESPDILKRNSIIAVIIM